MEKKHFNKLVDLYNQRSKIIDGCGGYDTYFNEKMFECKDQITKIDNNINKITDKYINS